jgi:hypothetical protein
MTRNSLIKVVKHTFLRKSTKFYVPKSFQSPGINFFSDSGMWQVGKIFISIKWYGRHPQAGYTAFCPQQQTLPRDTASLLEV